MSDLPCVACFGVPKPVGLVFQAFSFINRTVWETIFGRILTIFNTQSGSTTPGLGLHASQEEHLERFWWMKI